MSDNQKPTKWATILTLWAKGDGFYALDGYLHREGRHASRNNLPYEQYKEAIDELKSLGLIRERKTDQSSTMYYSSLVLESPYRADSPGFTTAKIGLAFFSDWVWHDQRELAKATGYKMPARIVADIKDAGYDIEVQEVREQGIRHKYRMMNHVCIRPEKKRKMYWRRIKQLLMDSGAAMECARCGSKSSLDQDHRVPVSIPEMASLTRENVADTYQHLCRSCNSAKREDCRRCVNQIEKSVEFCRACYWFNPRGIRSRRISLSAELEQRLNEFCNSRGLLSDKVVLIALERFLNDSDKSKDAG